MIFVVYDVLVQNASEAKVKVDAINATIKTLSFAVPTVLESC